MGRIGETIARTWQLAEHMRNLRGSLDEDRGTGADNFRAESKFRYRRAWRVGVPIVAVGSRRAGPSGNPPARSRQRGRVQRSAGRQGDLARAAPVLQPSHLPWPAGRRRDVLAAAACGAWTAAAISYAAPRPAARPGRPHRCCRRLDRRSPCSANTPRSAARPARAAATWRAALAAWRRRRPCARSRGPGRRSAHRGFPARRSRSQTGSTGRGRRLASRSATSDGADRDPRSDNQAELRQAAAAASSAPTPCLCGGLPSKTASSSAPPPAARSALACSRMPRRPPGPGRVLALRPGQPATRSRASPTRSAPAPAASEAEAASSTCSRESVRV
ncbi:hypothetical protein DPM13_12430 [Paracoccus mutanolyticus]|uniref:Uncharacterized protein n=1 Tax=Paracoccus mutanolyticus TaxID=1499308 RepID=A0ABM6WSL3_9RHOB|nr:hypothetical protein DPM13_12430 [Paracoccus mutanolyticus]